MIVVDTNVIVNLWVPGENSKHAEELIKKDREWAVPILWRSEFRSVMSMYLKKKLLTLDMILRIIENAEEQLQANEFNVSSIQVMELVNKSNCSAYDCEFICLAQSLKTKLITSDKQILKEFPSVAAALNNY